MNQPENILYERLKAHSHSFHKVVDFNPLKEKLAGFDLTNDNKELVEIDLADTKTFTGYVEEKLKKAKAKYGIGGYNELRELYARSNVFDARPGEEPRRLHLGVDIWGPEGTKSLCTVRRHGSQLWL